MYISTKNQFFSKQANKNYKKPQISNHNIKNKKIVKL